MIADSRRCTSDDTCRRLISKQVYSKQNTNKSSRRKGTASLPDGCHVIQNRGDLKWMSEMMNSVQANLFEIRSICWISIPTTLKKLNQCGVNPIGNVRTHSMSDMSGSHHCIELWIWLLSSENLNQSDPKAPNITLEIKSTTEISYVLPWWNIVDSSVIQEPCTVKK